MNIIDDRDVTRARNARGNRAGKSAPMDLPRDDDVPLSLLRHLGVGNKISGLSGYRRRENLGYFPAKQVTGKFRPRRTKVRLRVREEDPARSFPSRVRGEPGITGARRLLGDVATPRLRYRDKGDARGKLRVTSKFFAAEKMRTETRFAEGRKSSGREIRGSIARHCNLYDYVPASLCSAPQNLN